MLQSSVCQFYSSNDYKDWINVKGTVVIAVYITKVQLDSNDVTSFNECLQNIRAIAAMLYYNEGLCNVEISCSAVGVIV